MGLRRSHIGPADEALRLCLERDGIELADALNLASARVNQLVFVTSEAAGKATGCEGVATPYRKRRPPAP